MYLYEIWTILTLTGGEFSPVSQISFFGNLCNHFTNFRRKAKFPFLDCVTLPKLPKRKNLASIMKFGQN